MFFFHNVLSRLRQSCNFFAGVLLNWIVKGSLISEDIFNLVQSTKKSGKLLSNNFSYQVQRLRDSDFAHFFEEGTKLKFRDYVTFTCKAMNLKKCFEKEIIFEFYGSVWVLFIRPWFLSMYEQWSQTLYEVDLNYFYFFMLTYTLSLFYCTPSPRVTRILVPGKDRVMRKPC